MPLTMASIGEANTIRKVGGNEETKRFLENLGFVAGAEITVVSAIGGNVRRTRGFQVQYRRHSLR